MSKAWQAYARHILDTIEKIRRIQQRGDLTRDEVLYDATLRNLQTLSEATQRLPDVLKQPWPLIPWQQISGFRNILVHNYLGDIDSQTVLTVVQQHLPPLEVAIRAMLAADGE
ncbi:MAG: HepT-like ribonuclease domain-containing protein [Rhodanobacter sp.]